MSVKDAKSVAAIFKREMGTFVVGGDWQDSVNVRREGGSVYMGRGRFKKKAKFDLVNGGLGHNFSGKGGGWERDNAYGGRRTD